MLRNTLSAAALVAVISCGATTQGGFIEGKRSLQEIPGLGLIFTREKLVESTTSHKQTLSADRHLKLSLHLVVLPTIPSSLSVAPFTLPYTSLKIGDYCLAILAPIKGNYEYILEHR